MSRPVPGRRAIWLPRVLGWLIVASGGLAWAQVPPSQPAIPPPADALSGEPVPTPPPAGPVVATPREAALEDQVRQLKAMVEKLSERVEQLSPPAETATRPPAAPGAGGNARGAANDPAGGGPGQGPGGAAGGEGTPEGEVAGGSAAAAPASPPPASPKIRMPAPLHSLPLKAKFGPGFELMTEDEEYQFQFHNLTQVDYRGYWAVPSAVSQAYRSTFGIPRQWWIFSGRLTKPFEYYVVPAFGFDNVNLLDAFLNVHFDDRFQLKIGRYKTPFTYEFYNLPINGLINPERSLFFNNFGLNRDVGLMGWGQFFEKRLDYAVGLFNGARNFFIDRNNTPDLAAYVNFRPFAQWEDSPIQYLNVGGSVLFGNEFQVPVPQTFRTNVATTGSSFFGVPFLSLNNNIIESGDHALWDLHAAWYYNQFSILGEWGSGFQDYAHSATPAARTHLPVDSFYVQAGWFLTGETVSARGSVRPVQDFNLKPGKFGLGAIELAGRYNYLHIGNQVFTAGLADPNLWTNSIQMIDVGVNWYWTQYIKVYLGWQHAMFRQPVLVDPGHFQVTNDLLWARFQIYF